MRARMTEVWRMLWYVVARCMYIAVDVTREFRDRLIGNNVRLCDALMCNCLHFAVKVNVKMEMNT